jgi:hypothetical protein
MTTIVEPKHISDFPPEEINQFCRSLQGKTREEAIEAITAKGLRARVSSVDGSPLQPVQYQDTRISFQIIRGRVVRALPG